MAFDAFFLDAPAGRRFCVHTPAHGAARGAVLYLHPFAEEMNRSRKMAALQARALGEAGYAVLQIDLGGCGDSAGDFGDATWAGWVEDALAAAAWLAARQAGPLWFWGLRAGALVAAGALAHYRGAAGLLLLQPALSGEQVLRQFLRLKVGASLNAGGARGGVEALLRDLESGKAVEVAGYTLGPALAHELAAAALTLPAGAMRIECIELAPGPQGEVSPALAALAAQWRAAGHAVRTAVIDAPPFWQTVELTVSPAVVAATVAALAPQ